MEGYDSMNDSRAALIAQVTVLQRELVLSQMRPQSESLFSSGITVAQLHTLLYVHAFPDRPTAEVAEAVGMKPNIATGVVQRLAARGWLARTPDAHDGRVRRLSLTSEGAAFVKSVAGAAEQQFVDQLAALSDDQLAQLVDIFGTVAASIRPGD